MAKTLIVATKFTAIDKFTRVVRKMDVGISKMVRKAEIGFARVQRAERKMRQGFKKSLGMIGRLGLGFTALMIAQNILAANVKLDENLANLQAITGVTDQQFKSFAKTIDNVSKRQKRFAGDTANAFTIIGSAKPELLANADALGKVTEATMILSKASKDDLTVSAQNLTGAMNQFNLGADESMRVINALSAGSVVGSANISRINESLTVFGAVAKMSNVSLEQSVALIEVMSSKSIFGADAGQQLKRSILNLKAAGVGYKSGLFNIGDALEQVRGKMAKLSTAQEKDAYMKKVFLKTGITGGQILLENIDKYKSLTKAITGSNYAVMQADINSNTLKNRWNELVFSFQNAITTTDKENGALTSMKNILKYVAEHMSSIIKITGILIGLFIVYKSVMIATRTAIVAYNVAIFIANLVTGKFKIAMIAAKVAAAAWNIMTKIATAAQWLWNAAMSANPIGLIIIGIAALIVLVVQIIRHWGTWGKDMTKIIVPIYGIIEAIKWMKNEWLSIIKAFEVGGIGGGLKRIGQYLIRNILQPLKFIVRLAEKMGLVTKGYSNEVMNATGFSDEQVIMNGSGNNAKRLNADQVKMVKESKLYEQYKSTLFIKNQSNNDVELQNESPLVRLSNTLTFR